MGRKNGVNNNNNSNVPPHPFTPCIPWLIPTGGFVTLTWVTIHPYYI